MSLENSLTLGVATSTSDYRPQTQYPYLGSTYRTMTEELLLIQQREDQGRSLLTIFLAPWRGER